MLIGTLEIKLYAPWVHSLKEKRMVIKSLTSKLRNHFNAAVSEIAQHDVHQTLVIGVAVIGGHQGSIDTVLDQMINFVEMHTEAELLDIKREVL